MQFSRKSLPFIFLLLVSSSALLAQQPAYYKTNATFRKGLELFDNNQFASAAELFRQVYTDPQIAGSKPAEDGSISMMKADARYYEIICGLEQGNRQSQEALLSFITDYPERSEEHTSELQSLMRISYAVFCLKKKKKTKNRSQQ